MTFDIINPVHKAELDRLDDAYLAADPTPIPPEILYHYTSAEAGLAILMSGHLRATGISHLNDPVEGRYGESVIGRCLSALREQTSTGSLARRFSDEVSFSGVEESADAYVVSFSRRGDSLPEWRAYADNGAGIALGLDLREYRQSRHYLRCVEYDGGKQVEAVESRLHAVTSYLNSAEEGSNPELSLQAALAVIPARLFLLRLTFKPDAWQHEEEWRVIVLSTQGMPLPMEVRVERGRFIPFVSDGVFLTEPCLREVKLGPARDGDRDEGVLRRYLAAARRSKTVVTRSPTAFRP